MGRKIIKEKIVVTKKDHKCYGCGRTFPKGTDMNSASCKINNMVVRKYFCEGCHHIMTINNLTIDKFWYGELINEALTYEKHKQPQQQ